MHNKKLGFSYFGCIIFLMSDAEFLVKRITSKDENAALEAALEMINEEKVAAFSKLVETWQED